MFGLTGAKADERETLLSMLDHDQPLAAAAEDKRSSATRTTSGRTSRSR
jgi:hypothetical protein